MIEEIRKFTDSTNFTNAIKVTIAAVTPYAICAYLGTPDLGFTIAIGAFLTYPADIPSNLEHKIKGILVGASIVAACTLVVNLLQPFPYILYFVATIMLFFLSMISVYGHRANMLSFTGLLAVCLSFGQLTAGMGTFEHVGWIFAGGIFYLVVSLTFHFLRPHRYTELQLAECIRLTGKYLKLRGDLWNVNANRPKIVEKQLKLQVELNKIHENIREILIRNRPDKGNSTQNRKMLLVFISLVEIMELAISTSFDHNKIHEKFSRHTNVLSTYQNLAYSLAHTLKQLSKSIENKRKYVPKHSLSGNISKLEKAIHEYERSHHNNQASEGVWMLKNMLHYGEKQIEKIKVIRRSFTSEVDLKDLKGRDKDVQKFLTPIYYPLATLKENLSFSSTIFRHSLRLTMTILISFAIGTIFQLENIYWILLTIIVIMRPGYGLTKERSYQRILGTIIGGVIAFAILSAVTNDMIIGTLVVICIILGFTFTSINYTVGVTFVTMYVVFLYGILTPNINEVIQFRILDTVIGAALAFIANYFFWPSWEFVNLPSHLKKSIDANREYLKEISKLYNAKGEVSTSYRLARKNAFVEIGNLMASYQRMALEPKSKQKNVSEVYKLVVLNHTLLSSIASLGTYIQSHRTTKASEAFNAVVATVIKNLEHATKLLDTDMTDELQNLQNSAELAMRFTELKNIRAQELHEGHISDAEEFRLKLQEAQLVIEQLVWMNSLSEKIVKTAKHIKLTQ